MAFGSFDAAHVRRIFPAACAVAVRLPGLAGMLRSTVTVTAVDAGLVP